MKLKIFFKNRIEIPIFISVLITLFYSLSMPIFMAYQPGKTLMYALVPVLIGVVIHLIKINNSKDPEDLSFIRLPIGVHLRALGDYFIWLSLAIFSGSTLVVLIYSLVYIFQYGLTIRNLKYNPEEYSPAKNKFRDMNSIMLLFMFFLYISTLKSYIVFDTFAANLYVRIVFVAYVGVYLIMRNILKRATTPTIQS